MTICLLLVSAYVAVCFRLSGPLAEPAQAIISIFQPEIIHDQVSANSDAYRQIENHDLIYTALKSPLIGWGFGREFLQSLVLPDISSLDANYLYIPHNTLYWIWMRMGFIGLAALCYVLGSILIYGFHIGRRLRDPCLQLIAIYSVAMTCMEVIVAFADYQLFAYRNVIFLGFLAGMLLKLPALDETWRTFYENTDGITSPTSSIRRRWHEKFLSIAGACGKARSLPSRAG